MSQSKIINLSFVSAALLVTTFIHGFDPRRIEAANPSEASSDQLSIFEIHSTRENIKQLQDSQENIAIQPEALKQEQTDIFLADNIDLLPNNSVEETSNTELIRLLSLSFFLLFFVPLGIFYPLFLFYKMLLVKPDQLETFDDPEAIFDSDRNLNAAQSVNPPDLKQPTEKNPHKATVSKLQIAFSPPASQLRQQLSQVTSMADDNTDYDLVNLMRETVKILIEQGDWTHISHNSQTLPLEDVRPEFDLISYQERKKFTSKKSSLINYNCNVSRKDGYESNYSYVVVTLILCTSHSTPLFQTINTKKQLVKELVQLGKIEQDSVIRFELLWNPQQEEIYISNDQLLIEYGNMTRLL